MRVVSKWQEGLKPADITTIAESVAYNSWKIGFNALKRMQDERLYFVSKMQGLLVVAEFMIYQLQIADRMLYHQLEQDKRSVFIKSMADKDIEILADNRTDLQGDGSYRDEFVAVFNARLDDYAGLKFTEDGPGYGFIRLLGEKIGDLMGSDQDNRWAIDQVMEIEAPQVYQDFHHQFAMLTGL